MAQHVDEDVERDLAVFPRAPDVVPGVLLAREGVELAADAVDLVTDVPRGGPLLRALEEHVLGEVRDPAGLGGLVARAGGEHDETGDRLGVIHRRGQEPEAVRQGLEVENAHQAASASRQWSGTSTGRPAE